MNEIRDEQEVEKYLQRLIYTDDLNEIEMAKILKRASYLDVEFVEEIGNDNESYDLINVFDSNDELLVTYEDKRMYDYVSILELNEEI